MNNKKLSIFNKQDLLGLMDVANNSLFCDDISGLRSLFSQLNRLMPFNSVCCAYGDIRKAVDQEVPDVELLDISYPENYLDHYLGNSYHLTDPVMAKYLEILQPVDWNRHVVVKGKNIKYTEYIDAEPMGMRDGWTYGTVSPGSGESAMFFIASENYDSSDRSRIIIEYITPFLAEAYKRMLNNRDQQLTSVNSGITSSEIEILNWLKEGKTSWEISVILNKSERVVNFHINNIIKKLNAMNRTHAVVMALNNNHIKL